MFNLKQKLPKLEEGFSLLEVLVTAFVITGFLLGSLQAVTLATILRVQAQIKSEALNWIKSDSEQMKYSASRLDFDITTNTYTVNTNGCTTTTSNYGTRLQNYLTQSSPFNSSTGSSPPFPPTTTFVILNKTYQVSRTYAPNSTNGNVLQIRWQVWDEGPGTSDLNNNPDANGNPTGGDNDDKSISIISMDITPNVVLQCP